MVPIPNTDDFEAWCRIISGTLRVGDSVRVLGEAYTPEDDEDATIATCRGLSIWQGRYCLPVTRATAGSLVRVDGVGESIAKTATIVGLHLDLETHIFSPIHVPGAKSVIKIAAEPLNPSDLPKVVAALRAVNCSYPLSTTRVEESGEHSVMGTGELYLDSLMRDVREVYSDAEVKVADPIITMCETVLETSSLQCLALTPNQKNKITMIAEPLEKGIVLDAEAGTISARMPPRQLAAYFQGVHQWDALAARSLWAFGPDDQVRENMREHERMRIMMRMRMRMRIMMRMMLLLLFLTMMMMEIHPPDDSMIEE